MLKCRHCGASLTRTFIDLGSAPPSNAYLTREQLGAPETWYPLHVLICTHCWLAQTEDYAHAQELFDAGYAYFSSYSNSWLAHAKEYVEQMVERLNLDSGSFVVEIGANDGYLLQFVKSRGIPCLGVEPTGGTAAAARARGIEILQEFFGMETASRLSTQGRSADLIIANNVLGHVPDIGDFVSGIAAVLKPGGVATFEFPHLLRLVTGCQFDTIYHEHFSYLSLTTAKSVFGAHGLEVFDVEELSTHGGSLRVFVQRKDTSINPKEERVYALLQREKAAGMFQTEFYAGFQAEAERIKIDFLSFLVGSKRKGLKVAGYGAAAKGNTLLNYSGVRVDLMPYVVDRNPVKQGKYLPGSRIPIFGEEVLSKNRPHRVVIFPWNLREEIMEQLAYVRGWGGKFVWAVPELSEG